MRNCAGLLSLSEEHIVFLRDGKDLLGGQRISGTSANWSRRDIAMRRKMSGTHLSKRLVLTHLGPQERLEIFGFPREPL